MTLNKEPKRNKDFSHSHFEHILSQYSIFITPETSENQRFLDVLKGREIEHWDKKGLTMTLRTTLSK